MNYLDWASPNLNLQMFAYKIEKNAILAKHSAKKWEKKNQKLRHLSGTMIVASRGLNILHVEQGKVLWLLNWCWSSTKLGMGKREERRFKEKVILKKASFFYDSMIKFIWSPEINLPCSMLLLTPLSLFISLRDQVFYTDNVLSFFSPFIF